MLLIWRRSARFAFAFAALLALPSVAPCAVATVRPPSTRTDNVKDVLHGVEIVDPYRWLEDKDSPETRAWIDAQNQFTDSQLEAQPGREAIRKRLEHLLKVGQRTVPFERGGTYFYTKRRADQDLPVIVMRPAR
jgi:prolyl oligopeptidase